MKVLHLSGTEPLAVSPPPVFTQFLGKMAAVKKTAIASSNFQEGLLWPGLLVLIKMLCYFQPSHRGKCSAEGFYNLATLVSFRFTSFASSPSPRLFST